MASSRGRQEAPDAMDAVLKRFVEQSPVTVMTRLALQRAINAKWVDEVFERHRDRQYHRELAFSTVVDLMTPVALGLRPSLHAAVQQGPALPVSITALYDKVNHTDPAVVRGLVVGSAQRLAPVVDSLDGRAPQTLLHGYRARVVDGNHLPATDKRIKPLRGFRGAALPGHTLVVYDPDIDMVIDLQPSEDAHAAERTLMPALLAHAQRGDVWIADRHHCTRAIISLLVARRAAFILREGGAHPAPEPVGRRRRMGRVETGAVFEQKVRIPTGDGEWLYLRRVELELDEATEDGDTQIRLLTNLPARVTAGKVAQCYRRRWSIEGLFGRLEAALHGEVRTLGQPRAALLAFGLAVVAYNVLSVVQAAVAAAHDLEAEAMELSTYFVAHEVRATYVGLVVAVAPATWAPFDGKTPAQLARALLRFAAHVRPETLRKHPRAPKPKRRKGYAPRAVVQRKVATARVLAEGRVV